MTRTIILGAGLTGLSAAYHLDGNYAMFERETEVGGLCRTMTRDGFLFDYTGHLLHLRDCYTQALVSELLPGQFGQHARNAAIYTQGRYIEYPFQANIYALPPEIIKECILGFVETLRSSFSAAIPETMSFNDWVLRTLGAGIAKYFMFPYNQKLWRVPLEQLTADWVSWSIPKPTLDEFLNGALGIVNPAFGYNPTFLYPRQGGIDLLPRALLAALQPGALHAGVQATMIDAEQRVAHFNDSSSRPYDQLISTLPLPTLVSMLRDAPEDIAQAGKQLRHVSVYNVNIGVNRPNISDRHWIYFPDPEFVFYRIGFPTNFSDTVAPPGCSSMYVEISALPDAAHAPETLLDNVRDGLLRCGILRDSDEMLVADVALIDCAYVIHDFQRARAVQTILSYLERHHIYSVGRYGAWEYSSMEGNILAGKQIAERLLS